MRYFELSFDCDNAAFDDTDVEVARILTEVAKEVLEGRGWDGPVSIRDTNGNKVGVWRLGL